jgi:hypothetical protein
VSTANCHGPMLTYPKSERPLRIQPLQTPESTFIGWLNGKCITVVRNRFVYPLETLPNLAAGNIEFCVTLIQVDRRGIILCRVEQSAELCEYHRAIVVAFKVPRCQLHRLVRSLSASSRLF